MLYTEFYYFTTIIVVKFSGLYVVHAYQTYG